MLESGEVSDQDLLRTQERVARLSCSNAMRPLVRRVAAFHTIDTTLRGAKASAACATVTESAHAAHQCTLALFAQVARLAEQSRARVPTNAALAHLARTSACDVRWQHFEGAG